jgi:hypothetical protein
MFAGQHFNYFNYNCHQLSVDYQIARIRAGFVAGFSAGVIARSCRKPSGK